MSSKEISIETGWSPQTVDTYLKLAIKHLGVPNRRDAARALQDLELSQKTGSPTPQLVPMAPAGNEGEALETARLIDEVRPPPLGGKVNSLTWSKKSVAALRVAIMAAVTVLGLALLIAGVLRTFR